MPLVANTHAREEVATEIARLRKLSNEDLAALIGRPLRRELQTADAKSLMLETQVFRDGLGRRNLRVIVKVWDPAKRCPIGRVAKDDFVKASDGSFCGE